MKYVHAGSNAKSYSCNKILALCGVVMDFLRSNVYKMTTLTLPYLGNAHFFLRYTIFLAYMYVCLCIDLRIESYKILACVLDAFLRNVPKKWR